ncbi:MAG: hypothetical protein ACI3XR_06595 [Eubacteriales bacterium]
MNELLKDFWEWANLSPEQYAQQNSNLIDEFYYPQFDELLNYAKSIIDKEVCSRQEIEDVLMIMAIDNETEDVLDYLAVHCDDKKLEQYVNLGVSNIQPNVRWQIGELLYRRRPLNYLEYLRQLSKDEDAYVSKRTQNLLLYLSHSN